MIYHLLVKLFYLISFTDISMFFYERNIISSDYNWLKKIIVDTTGIATLNPILILLCVSILGVVFFNKRFFRILYSVLFFILISLSNGRDFEHGLFLWAYTSVIFIFIPDNNDEKKFENLFSLAQLTCVSIYFMSGFWKLFYGIRFLFSDHGLSYFHPNGLFQILLNYTKEFNIKVMHWQFFQEYGAVLFVLGLVVILLETIGVYFYFRRREVVHYWAISIITLHISLAYFMRIEFVANIILLSLLFSYSIISPKKEESTPYPY